MKSKLFFSLVFVSVASIAQVAFAKFEETTCYKLVSPSHLIVNNYFYDKHGKLDSQRSYRTEADTVVVKHIHSKEYREDGSLDSDNIFLEINVDSLGRSFTTTRIPMMDDGSFAADEDGGSDIKLDREQFITRLTLPRGASVKSFKRNKYGRKLIQSSEKEGRYATLSETKEPLTLVNVSCSRDDLR